MSVFITVAYIFRRVLESNCGPDWSKETYILFYNIIYIIILHIIAI